MKTVFSMNHYVVIFYSYLWENPMCTFLSPSFLKDKTKRLFTPWKLVLIKKSQYWFCPSVDIFVWYLFQLTALLKLDFNCSNSFALSWVDKVTTGT